MGGPGRPTKHRLHLQPVLRDFSFKIVLLVVPRMTPCMDSRESAGNIERSRHPDHGSMGRSPVRNAVMKPIPVTST